MLFIGIEGGIGVGKSTVLEAVKAHFTGKDVQFVDDRFHIVTNDSSKFEAEIVVGAYGKRSNIDVNLDRPFMKVSSPYLAVKAHYEGSFPDDLVCLHNFDGGYCGLSKVESDRINVCYITDYKSFKKYKRHLKV